ncbi:amino acid transporter family protein [Klebsormidium nitens]|uniref:Amino acid transporter family protein n=1 Tax=Klebsormidium nitens TaxID=105231 RepID=A0A1Y1IG11_KLENI|nr:amino acid transporter family protein [Klebsormidium nitens]|eukprot:GAQ88992.1 amino acid transporter family protein [Klebsormidium nitens]
MGFAVGICSLLLLGFANAYTCVVMLQSAEEFGTPESFHDLTDVSLGHKWAVLLDWVVGLTSFFACTQKLILAGDFGVAIKQRIITHNYLPNRALIVLTLTIGLALPLVFKRNMRALEKVSSGGVLCTLTVLAILIYSYSVSVVRSDSWAGGDVVYANGTPDLLLALPVQQFVFAGQAGVIPLYKSMKNRSLRNGKIMVCCAFAFCVSVNLCFGIFGYLQFPEEQEGDVLNNLVSHKSAVYTAMYFLAIAGSISGYPLNLTVGRVHLGNILLGPEKAKSRKWVYLMTMVFFVGTLGLGLGIKNLGVVQGLAGRWKRKPPGGEKQRAPAGSGGDRKSAPKGGPNVWSNAAFEPGPIENDPEGSPAKSGGQKSVGRSRDDGKSDRGKEEERENRHRNHKQLRKLPAYILFGVAAVNAGLATIGNLVSLILVGWDNASITFKVS